MSTVWNENKTHQFVNLSSCHQDPTWNAFPSYLSWVAPWVTSTSHNLNNTFHMAFHCHRIKYLITSHSFFYQLTWLCLYHVSYFFLPLSHGALYWYKLWPYLLLNNCSPVIIEDYYSYNHKLFSFRAIQYLEEFIYYLRYMCSSPHTQQSKSHGAHRHKNNKHWPCMGLR